MAANATISARGRARTMIPTPSAQRRVRAIQSSGGGSSGVRGTLGKSGNARSLIQRGMESRVPTIKPTETMTRAARRRSRSERRKRAKATDLAAGPETRTAARRLSARRRRPALFDRPIQQDLWGSPPYQALAPRTRLIAAGARGVTTDLPGCGQRACTPRRGDPTRGSSVSRVGRTVSRPRNEGCAARLVVALTEPFFCQFGQLASQGYGEQSTILQGRRLFTHTEARRTRREALPATLERGRGRLRGRTSAARAASSRTPMPRRRSQSLSG